VDDDCDYRNRNRNRNMDMDWIGLDWIGLDCEMKDNRDVSVVDIYLSIYCDNTTRYCCVCVCVCVCIYGTDDG